MSTSSLDIRVLGPVEVRIDGSPAAIGGPKPRALVAALAMRRDQVVSAESLIDWLWGERPPRTAPKTLQKYVSELRKVVGETLATEGRGYRLVAACTMIDACRFEHAVDAAQQLPPAVAVDVLEGALAEWRGEPFAELADHVDSHVERTRLEERRVDAEATLADAHLQLGRHASIVGRLEELVATHPLHEQLWSLLMLALYRSGRQAEALRAFRRLSANLEDIGLAPTPEARRLEQRILLQDETLAPPTEAPTNLPHRLTTFVGRTAELASVRQLMATHRLVTLVGAGGSGKTRLAVEAAAGDEGPVDGTWFVDLAPLTSPDELPKAIADPLGVRAQGDRSIVDLVMAVLATSDVLLIIDNCEHLVADVSDLVARMLQEAPRLRVLATSREPLRVEGETLFDVPVLPVPEDDSPEAIGRSEAVQLFVDRATAADAEFRLDADNGLAVAEICRRLDGIPLAIELAAARSRTYTPREIADLLDDRFELLTSARRDADDRHRTLEAAIHWSWAGLSSEERILLSRLTVFRGSFDRRAVEDICTDSSIGDTAIVQLLPALVDRSLLVPDHSVETSRYRLLETIREFGWSRLDTTEQPRMRDRHASYYCRLAESAEPHLRSSFQDVWLRRLVVEYGNLRRALRWSFSHDPDTGIRLALALATFWDAVGPRTEAQEWLRRAVELSREVDEERYVATRLAAADLFVSTDLSHSLRFANEAIAAATRTGNLRGEAGGHRALGWALALGGDYESAVDHGERAVALWRSIGDPWEIAWSLERLGESDFHEPERAVQWLDESLRGFLEVGDRRRAGMVMYKIAEASVRAGGDLAAAERHVEDSLEIFEALGSVHDSAHALLELGRIRRRRGEPADARRALETGLDRMRRVGDQRCETRTLAAIATALIDEGKHEEAWERLGETIRLAMQIGERQMARVALAGVGRVAAAHGHDHDAAVFIAAADAIAADLGIEPAPSRARSREERAQELRSRLGDTEYDAARKIGVELDEAEALGRALAMPYPGSVSTPR